jgi:dTDP-4-dehydrorhamnose reductase
VRVGVTGASGMLGTALINYLSNFHEVFATSRSKGFDGKNIKWTCFDLTNIYDLNNWLNQNKPEIVIHCAANIDVDGCEENYDLAFKLHSLTTEVIANFLDNCNGRLIYISTDSVFDGKKKGAYVESDLVNPLNVYAKTKLMGEQHVCKMKNGLILRVNIVGWTSAKKTSFSEWILNGLIERTTLNLFDDVIFSPIYVYDLSKIIGDIISRPIFGLYHCASKDSISKYNYGKSIAKIFKLSDSNIQRVSIDTMKFKANRASNMALNIDKIDSILDSQLPKVIDTIKLMKSHYELSNNFKKNK